MLMNSVCTCVAPIDFQDGVYDFDVGVNESIFFSFVCRKTHMNAQKCFEMKYFCGTGPVGTGTVEVQYG